jgi:hypothetical protein
MVEGKGEGRVYNSHGCEVFSYSRGIMLSLPIYLTLIFFFGKAVGRRFTSVCQYGMCVGLVGGNWVCFDFGIRSMEMN